MTQTVSPKDGTQADYKEVFAMDPEVGIVYRCNNCGLIHIQVEDVELRTDASGFHSLVALLNRAAAQHSLSATLSAQSWEGPVC